MTRGLFNTLVLAQDAAAKAESPTLSLLDYIRAGGLVGYILLVISVVSVGLIIAHVIMLRMGRLAPPQVVEGLDQRLAQGDIAGAVEFCRREENSSMLSRLIGDALVRCSRSPLGMLEIRSAVEESGQRQVDRLYRSVDSLGIIAAVGPMMGLLGTVFGMIGAFAAIGKLEGAARSQQLASFMSIALVATAEGLIVAIPATVAFALFRRRIDSLAAQIGHIAEHMVGYVEPGPVSAAGTRQAPHAAPARPQPPARPATPRETRVP